MDEKPRNKMIIGSVSIASITILLLASAAPSILFQTPEKKIKIKNLEEWNIIVPDDYPTIHQAVQQAKSGDKIFVKNGRYRSGSGSIFSNPLNIRTENITIQGENPDNTIIDGRYLSTVIYIYADSVKIKGFTIIRNGVNSSLITIYSNKNKIENNILKTNDDYEGIEYGIIMYSAHFNTIANNTIERAEYGIDTINSDNNTFINNTIENTDNAIDVDDALMFDLSKTYNGKLIYFNPSRDNKYINNTILNNRNGIFLKKSHGNQIENNKIISNNVNGLILLNCKKNKIINNNFTNDGLELHGDEIKYFKHEIKNNIVNKKPLYYYFEQEDLTVPSDAGQIIIINCRYITIKGVIISKTSTAVLIAYSRNIYVEDSEFSYNNRGVYLEFSTYCMIYDNNFIKNKQNSGFVNLGFFNSNRNTWNRNYWEKVLDIGLSRFKFLRYKIWGRYILKKPFGIIKINGLGIITKNYDRRQARQPYVIKSEI